ncbi:MAG TPA: co-chaperone GroES [Blastocatellia bacterium]|nr:co-chaperone GroES [Blastocatellia bacterium]
MTRLRPLHDRVVIRRIEGSEQTRSGIYIPETVKKKPQQGQVVTVGDGQILENGNRIPPVLKIEDRVFFDKYVGTEVLIDEDV